MSEYIRDEQDQIYADVAYRTGKIIEQYEKYVFQNNSIPFGEKYDVTLLIIALQSLVTNSTEYIQRMTSHKKYFKQSIKEIWGFNDQCWNTNFYEKTGENFIRTIRNALSHPTNTSIESLYPSTGYTTLKDNDIISKIVFINSPDSKMNRLKNYSKEACERELRNCSTLNLSCKENSSRMTQYHLYKNNEVFARMSVIELQPEQLRHFTKNLINYLAQPIQQDWDGVIINKLVV